MKFKRIVSILLVIALLMGMSMIAGAAYENTYRNTGNQAADIVGVAKTQVGYHEGTNNYTKYGVWYGHSNVAWCGVFIAWCADQANIPESVIPATGLCDSLKTWFSSANRYKSGLYYGGNYTPQPGDIIFYEWGSNTSPDHVGIVESVSNGVACTIEGNYSDAVTRRTNVVLSDKSVLGFGIPAYNTLATVIKQPGEYKVKASPYLNIRSGAGTSYSPIGQVPDGATVNVTSITNGWGKVTYNGVTGYVSLDFLIPTRVELEYITVTTYPTKTKYAIGEQFSSAGMVVNGVYTDGSMKAITDYTLSGFSSSTTGTKTINVTYSGKSTSFTVEVAKSYTTGTYKVIASALNLRKGAGTSYGVYTSIPNGTIVTVTNVTGEWGQVTYNSYTGWVSMEYLEAIASSDVDASIKLSKSRLEMYDTQTAVLTVETVPAAQNVTWKSSVTNVATVSNGLVTAIKGGETVVTASFTYGGRTYSASCTVVVTNRSVTSIAIKTLPNKTNYANGENLSTDGLVLTVNYDKGSSTTVSSGFTVSGYDKNKTGTQTVTVKYGGKTTTFTVKVSADFAPFKTIEYKGHVYSFYDEFLSYEEAVAKCEAMGGKLAAITSAEEQSIINNVLSEGTRNNYWIGLSDVGRSAGKYAWVTGETLSYTNWIAGQPNASSGDNAVIIQKGYGSKWNDVSTTYENAGFICEINVNSLRHSATKTYNGKTYYRFDTRMTWNDAKMVSEMFGGHLVTITSSGEYDAVKSLASAGSAGSYWIGATNVGNNGAYKWVTGEAFSYTNWATGAPDGENYVEMAKADSYKWNDVNNIGRNNTVTGFIVEVESFSITLDKSDISMRIGTKSQIKATVSGGIYTADNVKWSSADTSVASVSDSGLVTAVASGSTVIKAEINGTVKYCMVTVI